MYFGRDMVWWCIMTHCSHFRWYYCRGFNIAYALAGHFIRTTPLRLGRTRFALRIASNLHGVDSTRCWKHTFEILVHVDRIASHNCCRFGSWTRVLRIFRPVTSERCSIEFRYGDLSRPLNYIELVVMFTQPIWDDLCFVTSCWMWHL